MANLKEINEMLDDLARRTELTQQEKENTRNRLVRIEQKEQKEEAARVQLEDAKEKGEAFEESYNAAKEKVSETVTSDEEKVEDKEETKKTKKEKKNKKDSKLATGIIAGALAASLLLPAGHFAAKGIVDAIRGNKDDDKDSTSTIQEYEIDESKLMEYPEVEYSGKRFLPLENNYNTGELGNTYDELTQYQTTTASVEMQNSVR